MPRAAPPTITPARLDVSAPASVFVIAAVRLSRDGISEALQRAGHEVTGVAADVHEALALLPEAPPTVALLDAEGTEGRHAVGALRRRAPQMRVVVLAISGAKSDGARVGRGRDRGYVTRRLARRPDRNGTCRRRGEAHFPPEVNGALLEHVHQIATGRWTRTSPPRLPTA